MNHRSKGVFSALQINVCLPVLLGGAIYSLWRSKTLLVFSWYRFLGLEQPLSYLRLTLSGVKQWLPGPVLYSLPDALWVYSFTVLLRHVWSPYRRVYAKFLWISLPLAMSVGGEFGQLCRIVPGTFDLMDIVAYLGAWGAALAVPITAPAEEVVELTN